ncbi:MAG TPA: hypothetical protein ACFYEK_08975 [Candidatus Wunengus sp. YC60]|uniref:hypothetical protein n=1 Tax=Candidatus Wunengus sp. YC60 TaxID=3367697 RepID=UPI004029D608
MVNMDIHHPTPFEEGQMEEYSRGGQAEPTPNPSQEGNNNPLNRSTERSRRSPPLLRGTDDAGQVLRGTGGARQRGAVNAELGREIAGKLMHANRQERGEIVRYYMATYHLSQNKVYKIAGAYGYKSCRKARHDKGIMKCGLVKDELKLIAGMQKLTRRRNKTILMPTPVALELFNEARKYEGKSEIAVSASTVNRHLRRHELSRAHIKRNYTTEDHQTPAFCVSLRAEFVNEWHVFDITPCIQYYFKPKKGLAQRDMNMELYPGKLNNFKKIGQHLHRYVLIDFKSHCYFFKYYYSAGENLADLLDFLYSAWVFKEKFPFCGVPFNLYADKGAAMKSSFLRSVTERLGINLYHHKAGNSRAKGIVEERMKYIQEHFECKTVFRPAMSPEEINAWSLDWCVRDNATAIHTRFKSTRLERWMGGIQQEHRRELSCTKDLFMSLATSEPKPATVGVYMTIRFNGEEYYIRGPVNRGEVILVDYDYMDQNKIRTWKKDADGKKGIMLENKIVTWNKQRERDNAVQIGKEYKRLPDTPVQTAMKEMDKLDYSKVAAVVFGQRETILGADCRVIDEGRGMQNNTPPSHLSRLGGDASTSLSMTSFRAESRNQSNEGNGIMRRKDAETMTTITYSRHEVFGEIRHRMKLDRILPLQAELIEKILGEQQQIEDAVIEEICREIYNMVQTGETVQTVQTVQTAMA